MTFDLESIDTPPPSLSEDPIAARAKKRRRLIIIGAIIATLLLLVLGGALWYTLAQRPVDSSAMTKKTLEVDQGETPLEIGEQLQSNGLIRSVFAYRIYLKLHGLESGLKAGTYKIAPSENLASVVEHVTNGQSATFTITFYPGSTLYDPTDIADAKRTDVFTMLRRAGYSERTIREALKAQYESPLFAGKPRGTTLEGYVYGETYQFSTSADVNEILEHSFEIYYKNLTEHNIIAGTKKHGLNLYQAITLASIVQREVTNPDDMAKVAQVFYSRLKKDMPLGSDVTFLYPANQANMPATVDFDSPYNTRIHKGLPPGPISNPGLDALKAVANPAKTDYLYFVAGEDGKTYFSRTAAEHDKNVAEHCGDLCK
ncbi:MAG TPA: endolytic transglycosylase MltG [Patescibacteria group bacterium]|jgi:UPF0755 protein|nr:endolytic transglycosylase MltG [Patescibacteria group bacterium]